MDIAGLEKKMARLMAKMDCFLQRSVEERRRILSPNLASNGIEGNMLMIDNLLSMQLLKNNQQTEPEFYTDEIIKGIILVTHTSLMGNGEVRDEIETKIGEKRALEGQDLPKLCNLQNVQCETLRLYPPFPILVPREDSEDFVVGGFDVPRHTMRVVNAWAIHRDPEVWEDPTKRGCPGAGLANRLVELALGSLVQSFEWERIGEDMVDMSEGLGLMMPRVKPLEAMCKPRPFTLASM
ncbi:hypothetical protein PRUPE_1G428400 [Prunus persica]|uniref:Cytochrome P450 n=1 Tax=Prunus persica TaxID=3760 RepID=M5XNY7_PRUPE|nr:hypothetical protein PRUPE_1G428400 [Prunus persica]